MRYLIAKYGIGHGITIGAALFCAFIYTLYVCWDYREEIEYWVIKTSIRWSAWYALTFNDDEEECPDWADPIKWRESLR